MVLEKSLAEAEVEKWLTFKKVSAKKREDNAENIEKIIDAVSDGVFVINDNMTITHKLNLAINDGTILSLDYKPRVTADTFQKKLLGVKPEDGMGRVFAYIAGLSGLSRDTISKMDTDDYLMASQVAVFFMV